MLTTCFRDRRKHEGKAKRGCCRHYRRGAHVGRRHLALLTRALQSLRNVWAHPTLAFEVSPCLTCADARSPHLPRLHTSPSSRSSHPRPTGSLRPTREPICAARSSQCFDRSAALRPISTIACSDANHPLPCVKHRAPATEFLQRGSPPRRAHSTQRYRVQGCCTTKSQHHRAHSLDGGM